MVGSEWDLRRSFLLQNIHCHVSWSAASPPPAADSGYINPRSTVFATFFLSSTTLSFGIKNSLDSTNVLSGLESLSKRIHNIENDLLDGLKVAQKDTSHSNVLLKRHNSEHMPTMSCCDLKNDIDELMRQMSAGFISSIPKSIP